MINNIKDIILEPDIGRKPLKIKLLLILFVILCTRPYNILNTINKIKVNCWAST